MSAVKYIYGAFRALGIDEDDDRRDLYERVTGKRSLRLMSPNEQNAVVTELKRVGASSSGRPALSGPYAKKLQALWIAAWNLGIVRDRRDEALMAFVKRQCGIAHMRWLRDPDDAKKVVEALKNMMAREANVDWGGSCAHYFLKDQAAKVAWAIWCKLHPEAHLGDLSAFEARLSTILKRTAKVGSLSTRDWQMVGNVFGVQWRRLKEWVQ